MHSVRNTVQASRRVACVDGRLFPHVDTVGIGITASCEALVHIDGSDSPAHAGSEVGLLEGGNIIAPVRYQVGPLVLVVSPGEPADELDYVVHDLPSGRCIRGDGAAPPSSPDVFCCC